MLIKTPVEQILTKYAYLIQHILHTEIAEIRTVYPSMLSGSVNALEEFYGQMSYHLGWVDAQFSPIQPRSGKLLRPTLLLLTYEAAGAWGIPIKQNGMDHLQRALPAAAAIEFFHNFTLIHDDIEDGDVERRHYPTVWSLWGIPCAINTGDGLNSLSRLALFKLLDAGVDAQLVIQLGKCFDHACLLVTEGQHLDLCFETQEKVSIPQYLEMITRKTAALMACATEIGARLGSRDEFIIEKLRQFGLQLGMAFQIRDDLLGIWATQSETGKTPAGDLIRRKKTLPVVHALQHALPQDQSFLRMFYQSQTKPDDEQVGHLLEIFDRAQSRAYCQDALSKQCELARETLTQVSEATVSLGQTALSDLAIFIDYVAEAPGQQKQSIAQGFARKGHP